MAIEPQIYGRSSSGLKLAVGSLLGLVDVEAQGTALRDTKPPSYNPHLIPKHLPRSFPLLFARPILCWERELFGSRERVEALGEAAPFVFSFCVSFSSSSGDPTDQSTNQPTNQPTPT